MLRLVLILLLVPFGTCARAHNVAGTVFEVSSAERTPSAGRFVIVHWCIPGGDCAPTHAGKLPTRV
jgi:threonine dehydrogenase-like Zn-dependent dehydrogenase